MQYFAVRRGDRYRSMPEALPHEFDLWRSGLQRRRIDGIDARLIGAAPKMNASQTSTRPLIDCSRERKLARLLETRGCESGGNEVSRPGLDRCFRGKNARHVSHTLPNPDFGKQAIRIF